ncbi:M56 family metallopeptidase [Cellvibrio sp.]
MTTGTGSVLLHLWLVVGLATLGAALCMAVAQIYLLRAIASFNVSAKQCFLWCIALFPYGVGIYAGILVLTPALSHELGFVVDHHPLNLTQGHFHWFSWQGLVVMLLAGFTTLKLMTTLWSRAQQRRYLATLLAFSDVDARGCYRVDSEIPNAFTLGLIKPQILLSKALENVLTAEELDIVYRHEQAHQQAHDPLRLWLFTILLGVCVPPARRSLYAAMELLVEQQADATVARQSNDATLIANTLVKVNRLTLRYRKQQPEFHACAFCTTAVEQRIRQLLDGSDHGRAFPVPSFLLSTAALVFIGIYYANTLHHRIETLLHYHP